MGMPKIKSINKYIAKNFAANLLVVILSLSAIIFIFSFMDKLRDFADLPNVSNWEMVKYVLMEVTLTFDTVIPFSLLIAGISFFYKFSKSSEIVVMRSLGMSVWQIIRPIVILIFCFGVFYMFAGNAMVSSLRKKHIVLTYKYNINRSNPFLFTKDGFWLREKNDLTSCFINAKNVVQKGNVFELKDVKILMFDFSNNFLKKVVGKTGSLGDDKKIKLKDVYVYEPDEFKKHLDSFEYDAKIDADAMRKNTVYPDSIEFWKAPAHIRKLEEIGLATNQYQMYFYRVFFMPLSFIAMFFISVVFTLPINNRNVKFLYRTTSCIAAGFIIYFLDKIFYTMGLSQTLPMVLSVIAVPIICLLGSFAYLLSYEER